jgi:hypothetical protein
LIAANLNPDPTNECFDSVLVDAVRDACGSNWQSQFKSNRWHPHAEGLLDFHETEAWVFLSCIIGATVFKLIIVRAARPTKDKEP